MAFLAVFRSYAERPPLTGGCPVLNTVIESDDTNPALHERTRGVIEEWCDTIQIIVRTGIARREICREVDAEALALLLIATMEGAVMLTQLLGDAAPLEQAYRHLCATIEQEVRFVYTQQVDMRALTLFHTLRTMGLTFLIPGVVGGSLPDTFDVPGAYGDLLTVGLSFLALIALHARWRGALALVWLFSLVGLLDVVNAFAQGLRSDVPA